MPDERKNQVISETEEVYENALAGIRAVFKDMSATIEEIETNLQSLRQEVDILLEALHR